MIIADTTSPGCGHDLRNMICQGAATLVKQTLGDQLMTERSSWHKKDNHRKHWTHYENIGGMDHQNEFDV